jgi:hypothetical protein
LRFYATKIETCSYAHPFGNIDKNDCGGFNEKYRVQKLDRWAPRAKAQMVAVAVVHSSGHAAAREATYLYQTGGGPRCNSIGLSSCGRLQ